MSSPAFEPIAIVGQACVLPGALSSDALWEGIVRGDDFLSMGSLKEWRIAPERMLGRSGPDRTPSARAGYVTGFASVFRPANYGVPEDELHALDPLVQWTLHTAHEALLSAGFEQKVRTTRAGLVLGNLSYPSQSLSRMVEGFHIDAQGDRFLNGRARDIFGVDSVAPINRFMSGWPAIYVARLLGLSEGGFALDAACASSLYAIKLACNRLHDRRADLMLASGVNATDSLYLQVGFTALGAISPSGQCRPLHEDADGLLPSQGAACIVLRRLTDALADGSHILGVIRGVGVSNDGRGKGFLAPLEQGQIRAMSEAYAMAGLQPSVVSLIECHATGTQLGDATEVGSMRQVFRGCDGIAIGSIKSNIGHLVTAAGMAGLLKLLAAMRHRMLPPMRHTEKPIAAIQGSPFHLVEHARAWESDRPRFAGLNAFGFGGNNAHLILEQWAGLAARHQPYVFPPVVNAHEGEAIVAVGIGACVANGESKEDFIRALFTGESALRTRDDGFIGGYADQITLPGEHIRFPPNGLRQALPQQWLMLKAAIQALGDADQIDAAHTGVLVGMQCDTETCRVHVRWRLAEWIWRVEQASGESIDPDWLTRARGAACLALTTAGSIGQMPNIPANRINSHFDFRGCGYTISAEQASGIAALDVAIRALRMGELNAAVVGAVDLGCDRVHQDAAETVLAANQMAPGDAAVAIVLKRLSDARRDRNHIYGVVSADKAPTGAVLWSTDGDVGPDLATQFGHAHAASGLMYLAAALLACRHSALPQGSGRVAIPWYSTPQQPRSIALEVGALGGMRHTAWVGQYFGDEQPGLLTAPMPKVHFYAGDSRMDVLQAVHSNRESEQGSFRLALVASTPAELQQRLHMAQMWLERAKPVHQLQLGDGIFYREAPIRGEIGFVYTMAAACYEGMGQSLMLALPELSTGLVQRFRDPAADFGIKGTENGSVNLLDQLRSYSLLCHAHTELSTTVMGLQPTAAIGLCTGESSTLFCLGAWSDVETALGQADAIGLYTHALAGEFAAVRQAWGLAADAAPVDWATWRVLAPLDEVQATLRDEPRVHIAIVHTMHDCLVAGEAAACERAIAGLGHHRAKRIENGMAIHCPELVPFADTWRALHRRSTQAVPGIRFYSQALGTHYPLNADAVADALTAQALQTVHFPRVIEQAWHDGVRVFIEHGPRGLCSGWVRQILGERDHVAINLDSRHCSGVRQLANVTAQLWVAHVPVRHQKIAEKLLRGDRAVKAAGLPGLSVGGITMPAHLSPVVFPPLDVCLTEVVPTDASLFGRNMRLLEARDSDAKIKEDAVGVDEWHVAALSNPSTASNTSVFSRKQLEVLASGSIASVFGPLFEQQEKYLRQVRMPMPPLLLTDRVMRIDAVPGRLAKGAMWTETDVQADAWYMHRGHMPAGVMIEAGQADLLLISWMGIDFKNKGQRVYRLLGSKLTFHGSLPRPGETLSYEIRIDGHARHENIDLFFFHYDCKVDGIKRLTVTGGQAGFFSDEDLANSRGVLWDAATSEFDQNASITPPVITCRYTCFSEAQVRAFAQGRLYECFGPGFELAQAHIDSPRIPDRQLQLFDRVTHVDPEGGPWRRGYLRAELTIMPDHWFFDGHFLNDPCMPGTLMFEGCMQAMAFYLTVLGFSIDKDGWRFEPVPDETLELSCRGQVTPRSKQLVYEIYIEESHTEPVPELYAALLCTVDGLKSFHVRRIGYRLIPSWPLQNLPASIASHIEQRRATNVDGFQLDYESLLTAARGKASDAFGERYAVFDSQRITNRPPGPPYLFVTRIVKVQGTHLPEVGATIAAEYDIPPNAWYFAESAHRTMPFCILLEAALQPCGLLALCLGCPLLSEEDLKFRNLDGTGTTHAEVAADARVLKTRATLISMSRASGMLILSFEVVCEVNGKTAYTLKTVFGYFPQAAFDSQVGLPAPADVKTVREFCNVRIDLKAQPMRYCGGDLKLPNTMLLMIHRVVGFWPQGGKAGLGRMRAEKDVDPSDWFFKAHFYQDPVQPGSLGLEAMLQLLQFYMLHKNLGEGITKPRFEPAALGLPMTWKYRGQVLPKNRLISIEMEITDCGHDEYGPYAVARAWLWVDDVRIYEAIGVGMRIVSAST